MATLLSPVAEGDRREVFNYPILLYPLCGALVLFVICVYAFVKLRGRRRGSASHQPKASDQSSASHRVVVQAAHLTPVKLPKDVGDTSEVSKGEPPVVPIDSPVTLPVAPEAPTFRKEAPAAQEAPKNPFVKATPKPLNAPKESVTAISLPPAVPMWIEAYPAAYPQQPNARQNYTEAFAMARSNYPVAFQDPTTKKWQDISASQDNAAKSSTKLARGIASQAEERAEYMLNALNYITAVVPQLGCELITDAIGARVVGIHRNSPASKAGLYPGDIIVQFHELAVTSAEDVYRIIRGVPPGVKTWITARRPQQQVAGQVRLPDLCVLLTITVGCQYTQSEFHRLQSIAVGGSGDTEGDRVFFLELARRDRGDVRRWE